MLIELSSMRSSLHSETVHLVAEMVTKLYNNELLFFFNKKDVSANFKLARLSINEHGVHCSYSNFLSFFFVGNPPMN